ncbi:type II toxin-antitoxin system VapC family toxin [Pigmentiphaga soli]|uniref:Type II toxin-antitoxin system VapC family toxin n=1 Tax=Pigmentiphaga soli TaxID=1007095 RepID=A0ABP8HPM5_9BURK
MAALDTNVLVRYLVRDDPRQEQRARTLIGRCVAAGESLFVPITVALELEWVLRSRFGFQKGDIAATFSALLSTSELQFESETGLEIALAYFKDGTADFSDCMHIALAGMSGHGPFWTFDRAASRLDGAKLIG